MRAVDERGRRRIDLDIRAPPFPGSLKLEQFAWDFRPDSTALRGQNWRSR